MTRFRRTIVVLATCLFLSACGSSGGGSFKVSDPWVRIDNGTGAAYMTLDNETSEPDALIGVIVDPSVSETVELRRTAVTRSDTNANVETMTAETIDRIDVPAGGQLTLSPGGYFVGLDNVQGERQIGDKIALTLQFEKAGQRAIEADLRN